MTPDSPIPMTQANSLALASALGGLVLGGGALGLAWTHGSWSLAGFGLTALIQAPVGGHLRSRIQAGFGNRGLDQEHRLLATLGILCALLALGLALGGASALLEGAASPSSPLRLGFSLVSTGATLFFWLRKRGWAGTHPILARDASLARLALESALFMGLATLLTPILPQADAGAALLMALRLTQSALTLRKAIRVAAPCGGCGGGCR